MNSDLRQEIKNFEDVIFQIVDSKPNALSYTVTKNTETYQHVLDQKNMIIAHKVADRLPRAIFDQQYAKAHKEAVYYEGRIISGKKGKIDPRIGQSIMVAIEPKV